MPSARRAELATRKLGGAGGAAASALGRLVPVIGAAAVIRGLQQYADTSTRISNALKVAGLEGGALTKVYDRLFQSAQRNVAPIESLVTLYGRAALVQKELNITSEELLGFTDKVAVALRVSGQSAQESSGALLQLSQALGSGIVRAEEFNSILEGALPIAQAAAAGLEEAGGSVAKLRSLVINGKVSSEAFFRAFEAGSVILDKKVAGAELTVSQGFIRLQNVLIGATGRLDDTTGASKLVAGALGGVADVIQDVTAKGSVLDTVLRNMADNAENAVDMITKAADAAKKSGIGLNVGPVGFHVGATSNAGGSTAAAASRYDPLSSAGTGVSVRPSLNPVSLSDYTVPTVLDPSKIAEADKAWQGLLDTTDRYTNALTGPLDAYAKSALDVAGGIGGALENAFRGAEDSLTEFVMTGKTDFKALANSIIADLVRIQIRSAITGALASVFGGLLGGPVGALGGGAISSIGASLYHSGRGPGERGGSRNVHPAYFDNAPRYHSGVGPGEEAAIIRKDESVLTPGQMKAIGRMSGGPVTVHVHNAPAGTTAESRQSRDANGG
ncbi:MAG: tape measure protein, partial [Rhizobiaceae bacterium]|nr:tape measure protein [Rhizobiaceae bacterium]